MDIPVEIFFCPLRKNNYSSDSDTYKRYLIHAHKHRSDYCYVAAIITFQIRILPQRAKCSLPLCEMALHSKARWKNICRQLLRIRKNFHDWRENFILGIDMHSQ